MVKKINDNGSALAWTIMLMLIATVILVCILPLATSSIADSNRENYNSQAYYTAKSVTDMVVEYIVSDDTKDPAKTILEQAKAGGDLGYEWAVEGLDEDMGQCKVNCSFKGDTLYIKSTANYNGEEKTITAILSKQITNSTFEAATPLVTGYYWGLRAGRISGINPIDAKEDDEFENIGLLHVSKSDIVITKPLSEEYTTKEEDVSSVMYASDGVSYKMDGSNTNIPIMLYTYNDIIDHNKIINPAKEKSIKVSGGSYGDFIYDNPGNLFYLNPYYKRNGSSNSYGFYTAGTVKLSGQILVGELNKSDGSRTITAGTLILDGRSNDSENKDIPEGITVNSSIFYIEDSLLMDNVRLNMRTPVNNCGIMSDGPVIITNANGPSVIQGMNNDQNYKYGISTTYFSARSTTANDIKIFGDIYSVSMENYSDKRSSKYSSALTLDEMMSIRQQQLDASKEFDDNTLYKAKEYYTGDVYIEANDADGSAEGSHDAGTVYVGNIRSNGLVTLKGNVNVNGDVTSKRVHITSDRVSISGTITCTEEFVYYDEMGNEIKGADLGALAYPATFSYDETVSSYVYVGNAETSKINQITGLKLKGDPNVFHEVDNIIKTKNEENVLKISDIPNIKTLSAANMLALSKMDLRNSTTPYNAFTYSGNCDIGNITLDSYGDVYIIIPENTTVSIDSISSKVYYSNLFFIVKNGGTLRLNYKNNVEGTVFNTHVYGEEGSNLVLGDDTKFYGIIDIDNLYLGKDVYYETKACNSLSGAQGEGHSTWQLLQYTN